METKFENTEFLVNLANFVQSYAETTAKNYMAELYRETRRVSSFVTQKAMMQMVRELVDNYEWPKEKRSVDVRCRGTHRKQWGVWAAPARAMGVTPQTIKNWYYGSVYGPNSNNLWNVILTWHEKTGKCALRLIRDIQKEEKPAYA